MTMIVFVVAIMIALVIVAPWDAIGSSGPPTPMSPFKKQQDDLAVLRDNVSGLATGDYGDAIPATGTVTENQCKGSVLNDSALTGNTDVQLLDLEYDVTLLIVITHGTYSISLVPPSGEKMKRETVLQTANNELDLSSNEGDTFILRRIYSNSETGWVWQVGAWIGTTADGGAAD
jgi:hypothetical protein